MKRTTDIAFHSQLEVLCRLWEASPSEEEHPSLYVVEPLATGPRRWCQTWLGLKVQQNARLTVVIKLFQQSKFPITQGIDPSSAEELAKNEFDAYKALVEHQGAMVPTSYGFFKIKVTTRAEDGRNDPGETVIAHVMEHINAVTASKLESQRILSSDSAEYLLKCLRAIHSRGVVHKDLSPYNILLQHPLNTPRPFFIDFGMAKTYTKKDSRSGAKEFEEAKLRDEDCLMQILYKMDIQLPSLQSMFPDAFFANVRSAPLPLHVVGYAEILQNVKPLKMEDWLDLSVSEWIAEREAAKKKPSEAVPLKCQPQ